MASPQELSLTKIHNSDVPQAPIVSNGLGYEVEERLVAPKDFPKAPITDVFGRTEVSPRVIEDVLTSAALQSEQQHKTPSPWGFLPKGPFFIENGQVIPYLVSPDTSTRRGREAIMASIDPEHSQFSSAKRQAAKSRVHKNTRGGLRPTQGGRR